MTTSLKHPIRQMPFFSACKDTTFLKINALNHEKNNTHTS